MQNLVQALQETFEHEIPHANIPQRTVVSEANPVIPTELRRYLDQAGRILVWPAKKVTRLQVFAYLAAFFQPGQIYSEKEVNQLLTRYLACNNYVTVRRDMCDFLYLQRERDGARYWRIVNSETKNKMDKRTLLNTISTEHARFETLVTPLSEAQLCTAIFDEQWSIKDIMTHIAVWEQLCTRWLEEFLRGETPQPSERLDNESNDRIYREHRDRSLAEVQNLFYSAHQQFLSQVNLLAQTCSEEELNASHCFAWTEVWPGSSLIAVIADNSYEHYCDHAQHIRHWLDVSKMA